MKRKSSKLAPIAIACVLIASIGGINSSKQDTPETSSPETTGSVSFVATTIAETTEEETPEADTEADPPSEEVTEPSPEETPEETPAETFAEYQMYADGSVNIRSGPGGDQEILGQTGSGDPVTVIGPEENGWLPISYNGQTAYMSSQFLSTSIPEPETQAETVSVQVPAPNDTSEVIVYITDTGSKYHSSGCRYLKKSQHSISLGNAISQGYGPCSVCHPPTR